jgi:hypothetical protein
MRPLPCRSREFSSTLVGGLGFPMSAMSAISCDHGDLGDPSPG